MDYSLTPPAARDPARGEDDAALVHAARADPAAFDALYRRYVARIYRYARAHTPGEDDAADLTQQIFLKALDALPRYRERGLPFAAWLFRIARNAAVDAHRRRRPTIAWDHVPEVARPPDAGDPEAAALRRERATQLRHLLDALDRDRRELLALRFAAGLPVREIAAVIGKSEAAVKKQLARTLRMLKEQYHDR